MKTQQQQWQQIVIAGLAAHVMTGICPWAAEVRLSEPVRPDRNRVNISGRFLFNVSAEFRHQATAVNPGPGVGVHGANHVYDNGYVNVDDSGNAGNLTWNWGYQDPASVVGTTLELSAVSSPASGPTQRDRDDPQYGFEISYGRVLKQFELSSGRAMQAGLFGAFGMTLLDIQSNSRIDGATTGVRDTYKLDGLPIIPGAPYFGAGPAPGGPLPLLIPDAPDTRAPINVAASATERMKVEGEMYGFKLGPFFELPVTQRIAVQVQGGFAALLADGKFAYSESISTGGTSAGRGSRSEWLFGGFVEGQVSVSISPQWNAFAGAGWQSLSNYQVPAGSKEAKVRLDNSVVLFGGLSYQF